MFFNIMRMYLEMVPIAGLFPLHWCIAHSLSHTFFLGCLCVFTHIIYWCKTYPQIIGKFAFWLVGREWLFPTVGTVVVTVVRGGGGGDKHILENGKEISYLYFFAPVLAKIFTADFFIQNNFSVCQAMRFLN